MSKNVSAVYVWVTSKAIKPEEAAEIVGIPTHRLLPRRPEFVWCWQSEWHHDDDVSPSLERFLSKDLPAMNQGLQTLVKAHGAQVSIDWVLGLGVDEHHGVWPVIELSPEVLARLKETGFTLQIHIDDQISAAQLGLE